jgi:DNA-binding NtrC family response regulator
MTEKAEVKILVVEDNDQWQKKLRRMLTRDGYEVTITDNEDKARSLLHSRKAEHQFDVVVLDLRLEDWGGGYEGMDLLKKDTVRLAEEQHTRVLILTGYGEVEHVRSAFRDYGVFDFMDKRRFGDGREFRDQVRKAIAARRAELADRQ